MAVAGTVGSESDLRRAAVVGATVGNLLEWYDWGVYAFFAPVFASHFFSSKDPLVPLILTLATFALGFLMRPIGGIVLGSYGDRHGRRAQLILSIVIMAAASLLIGVLPGIARIGVLAPLLLLIARLAQGLSAGGEFGGSSAFLVEYAAPDQRAFVGSWQQFSVGAGTLVASGIATLLTNAVPHAALYAWGWRIPFLLGGLIGVYGIYLRWGIGETPAFERVEHAHKIVRAPAFEALRRYPKEALRIVGITLAGTVVFYVWLLYMPTYAAQALGIPLATAQIANTVGLVIFIALIPFQGMLSDRFGRKALLSTFAIGFVVLTYPLFNLLHAGTFAAVLITELVGVFFLSMFSGSIATVMAEQFPTEVRVSGIAFPYALGVALFGGTAPLLATYMLKIHLANGIVFYVIISAAISALVYLTMPETYRKQLA
jgi:MHS family alpha-ketoglutarate permease-like MFS transporter